MSTSPTLVSAPVLDVLLAIAAIFLGLALLVQVVQEIWKYLTSSKAITYHKVLRDFFGSWVERLYEAGPAAHLQVRGPLQFLRSKPTGVLLPLEKEELLEAMDTITPGWMGYLLEALKAERRLQAGQPAPPSPQLQEAMRNLRTAVDGPAAAAAVDARKVVGFLRTWLGEDRAPDAAEESAPGVDAARLVEAFYQEFNPDRIRADREFKQLAANFEHAYQRRNLRQTFILGLLAAAILNLPFDELYRRASSMSPEQANQLAQAMEAINAEIAGQDEPLAEQEPDPPEQEPNPPKQGPAPTAEPSPDEPATPGATAPPGETAPREEGDPIEEPAPPGETAATDTSETLEEQVKHLKTLIGQLVPADGVPFYLRGYREVRGFFTNVEPPAAGAPAADEPGARDAMASAPGAPAAGAGRPATAAAAQDGERQAKRGLPGLFDFLANCLITALLISFGAPFWHRLTEALLATRKPLGRSAEQES